LFALSAIHSSPLSGPAWSWTERRERAHRIAGRRFDFDDVRAEVGEDARSVCDRGGAPGVVPRDLDDAQAVEQVDHDWY
jgi:hypothetical protein